MKNGLLLLTLLLVITAGLAVYYNRKYQEVSQKDPIVRAEQLVERLKKTVVLPEEVPTLAEVTDKTKLGNALLSEEAENGDEILIFSKSKKAILFRPSLKKVVNIYPLSGT